MRKIRTDEHSPSRFDPAEYEYTDLLYQGPTIVSGFENDKNTLAALEEHGFDGNWKAKGSCDHCGAAFHYGAVFTHGPTGEMIVVGNVCADEAFGHADRRSYDLARMKGLVIAAKARARVRAEAALFLSENPGLAEALETEHHITEDIARRFFQYGNLSEKQVALVFKIADDVKNAAARKAERDAKMATAPDLEEGRRVVEGEVLSTKLQDSVYGSTFKMLVEEENGNRVWGTVPASLLSTTDPVLGTSGVKRGDRVRFTATVARSKDDTHFGFYKRPAKAEITSPATAA